MRPLVLVRPDRLGDVVLSSAVLRGVIERYGATREIIWSVPQQYTFLFEKLQGVQIIPCEKLLEFLISQPGSEVVFLNPAEELQSKLPNEIKWHGFDKTLPDRRKRCDRPEAQECTELLLAAGLPIDITLQPFLAPGAAPRVRLPHDPYIVLHAGAFGQKPSFSPKVLEDIVWAMADIDIDVVWIGRKHLEGLDRQLPVFLPPMGPQVPELVAYLRQAKGVIGRDSGVAHLGAGLGVPTVALIGPLAKRLAARRWAPQGASVKSLELPLKPYWLETESSYQRRYFNAAQAPLIINALEELWRCQPPQ